ncbi:MAG: AbgT family transporter [Calditrichaeota bacterium]|nr:AbgT family transporter [Calditrichota bacterium]
MLPEWISGTSMTEVPAPALLLRLPFCVTMPPPEARSSSTRSPLISRVPAGLFSRLAPFCMRMVPERVALPSLVRVAPSSILVLLLPIARVLLKTRSPVAVMLPRCQSKCPSTVRGPLPASWLRSSFMVSVAPASIATPLPLRVTVASSMSTVPLPVIVRLSRMNERSLSARMAPLLTVKVPLLLFRVSPRSSRRVPLVALMLPVAGVVLVAWLLFLIAWFLLGIPLGPGYPVSM